MNYLLDAFLLLIIGLTVFIYYKRGFVKAVLGLGKTLFSFICAGIFGKMVGDLLAEKYFDAKIYDMVYNKLAGVVGTDGMALADNIPSSLRMLAEHCGADLDEIIANAGNNGEWVSDVSSGIAGPISSVISVLLGYIIVFIGSYLIFLIGSLILESVVELPVLRSVNRLLGLLLGCVSAVAFAFLFVFIVKTVIYYGIIVSDKDAAADIINKTYVFRFFSNIGNFLQR